MSTNRLDHYELIEEVGRGGGGTVWKARDIRLGREVAIKVLSPENSLDPHHRERFLLEAKAASALNHPNIVSIHEINSADGLDFIVMEFVRGTPLSALIPPGGMRLEELHSIAVQIADALATAHAAGIVHRDVKPSNVMVDEKGRVRILDFGLAKLMKGALLRSGPDAAAAEPHTLQGVILGTIWYMSPEQASGLEVDARSDMFSFGSLLFEMATGRKPFVGENDLATLRKICSVPPPRLEELRADLPADLRRLVYRLLEKDPAKRYEGLAKVVEELHSALDGPAARRQLDTTMAMAWQPVRGKRWLIPVLCIIAALVAAGTVPGVRNRAIHWIRSDFHSRGTPAQTASLAVIPFSGAPDLPAHLPDGISEGLIDALSRLPGVTVIARSSSFRFRSGNLDPMKAASALRVHSLVTGRVTSVDGRLHIAVELMNGPDGVRLWGAQYAASPADLHAVEAGICAQIAHRIGARLAQSHQGPLPKPAQIHPEAYELLLRARYHSRLYTPESRRNAVSYYEQAIAIDPSFALAQAELAYAYRILSGSALVAASEAMPKARAAAQRALAADPDLPEAHAAAADIEKDFWNWPAAESEYRRAIELNPNLASAHRGYAIYLGVFGRHDEALREIGKARELDPLGLPTALHVGVVYYNARRFDESIEAFRQAGDLDPAASAVWSWTGMAHAAAGQCKQALVAYEKAREQGDTTAATQCMHAYALARAGRSQEAREILGALQRARAFVPPFALAIAYTGLSWSDRAMETLQAAYAARDPLLQYLNVEPHFDTLSADPRFQELARKVGIAAR